MNTLFAKLDALVIGTLLVIAATAQCLASTPVQVGGKHGIYPVPSLYQGTVQDVAYSAVNSTTASGLTSSVCLTSVGSLTGIQVGAIISDTTNSTYITAGTTVVALPGTCSTGQIQMSVDAAHNLSGDTLSFLNPAGVSAAFQAATQLILISCSTDCYFLVGSSPVAASTTGTFLPAKTLLYVGVNGGQKISAIQSAATGTLNVTEGGTTTHSI